MNSFFFPFYLRQQRTGNYNWPSTLSYLRFEVRFNETQVFEAILTGHESFDLFPNNKYIFSKIT